jgi:hypothetical protein
MQELLEKAIGAVLLVLLFAFSLDFDRPYAEVLHNAARHPFFRFLAGLSIALLGALNPVLGLLGLLVVFFWIADVNLLSRVDIAKFRVKQ